MTDRKQAVVIWALAAVLTGLPVRAEMEQPVDIPEFEPEPFTKGPPLPVHTIFGVGGGSITPMAKILNPGPPDRWFSTPTVSATYMDLSSKDLQSFIITETLFQRVELGFAATRLGLGNLRAALRGATGFDIGQSHLFLYSFNARALIIEDGQFGPLTPAVAIGAQIKFNDSTDDIDAALGGALTGLGYDQNWGTDFTLTATKMIPEVFGRPLLLTAGLRVSQGAWGGLLGFSEEYQATFEAHALYIPFDWMFVAYEYRQMPDPYATLGTLVREPGDWHAAVIGLILSDRLNMTFVYGRLGDVVNEKVNNAWAVQMKYEF